MFISTRGETDADADLRNATLRDLIYDLQIVTMEPYGKNLGNFGVILPELPIVTFRLSDVTDFGPGFNWSKPGETSRYGGAPGGMYPFGGIGFWGSLRS